MNKVMEILIELEAGAEGVEWAMSSLHSLIMGEKETEHGDFCGTRPEWRDKQNNGGCDCDMPAHNFAIEKVASLFKEDLPPASLRRDI